MKLFEKVRRLEGHEDVIRRRRYGTIVVRESKLDSIQFRPWPKLGSVVESIWATGLGKKRIRKDRVVLYYSQPIFHSNFLTLNYIESSWQTSLKSLIRALAMLDQVARIKQSDALLCEVANSRISDRALRWVGWEPQQLQSKKRHWIKRYYGVYPDSNVLNEKTRAMGDECVAEDMPTG